MYVYVCMYTLKKGILTNKNQPTSTHSKKNSRHIFLKNSLVFEVWFYDL